MVTSTVPEFAGGAVVGVLLAVTLLAAVLPQETPQVIQRREFQTIDDSGKVRAIIGAHRIAQFDENGTHGLNSVQSCYGHHQRELKPASGQRTPAASLPCSASAPPGPAREAVASRARCGCRVRSRACLTPSVSMPMVITSKCLAICVPSITSTGRSISPRGAPSTATCCAVCASNERS